MSHSAVAAHPAGPTRVATDDGMILTGGSDGVVKLYRGSRWTPNAVPLWSCKMHEGPVTCVVLRTTLGIGFSAGRDGHVCKINVTALAEASLQERRKVICRVSGEIYSLALDNVHMNLFVASDSLRYVSVSDKPFVQSVSLHVPPPYVSVAVSPCGNLIAVASGASGDVGVVGLQAPAAQEATQTVSAPATSFPYSGVRFLVKSVISSARRKDDKAALGLSWCRFSPDSSSYLLAIPCDDGVRLMRLLPADDPANKEKKVQFLFVSTISLDSIRDITSVRLLPNSKQFFSAVVVGRRVFTRPNDDEAHGGQESIEPIALVMKIQHKKFAQNLIGNYPLTSTATDAALDVTKNGNLVVATCDGAIGLFKSAVPLPRKPRETQHSEVKSADASRAKESNDKGDEESSQSDNDADDEEEETSGEDDEEDDQIEIKSKQVMASNRHPKHSGNAEEDMNEVVKDLVTNNKFFVAEDVKRPTELRQGLSKIGSTSNTKARLAFLDDEAEEGGSSSSGDDADHGDGNSNYDEGEEEYDNADGDPEGASESEAMKDIPHAPRGGAVKEGNDALYARDYCFQPGATPIKDPMAPACYLAYNTIGFIRYSGSDGTFIGFHDVSRVGIKLLEKGRVLLAAIGHIGSAFVIENTGVGDEAAVDAVSQGLYLYFRTYVSIGAQADWRVQLLPDETVRCLAVGLRYVAVATSVGLRIFSLSGLEIAVLSVPRCVVCMTGCNSARLAQTMKYDHDPLALVFQETPLSGLQFTVLNVHNSSVLIGPSSLPVTGSAELGDHYLEWIGWSDDGPLHTVDTAGVVRMFSRDWGGMWTPVFDPRHFTTDNVYKYWVWGASDEHIFTFKCPRGAPDHYPVATSTSNTMDQVRLCLPLLRQSGGEKMVILRDRFLRTNMKVNEMKRTSSYYTEGIAKLDFIHDSKLTDLFRQALRDQQTSRAIDIATMMQLRESVEQAAHIANDEGHKTVVHKIVNIIDLRHKMKLKRLCTLPLEGQDVTEKEKDMLLKKFLLREKQQQGGSSNVAAQGGVGQAGTTVPLTVRIPTTIEKTIPAVAEALPPSDAVAEDSTAARVSKPRRSVEFADEVVAAPTVHALKVEDRSPSTRPTTQPPQPAEQKKQSSPFGAAKTVSVSTASSAPPLAATPAAPPVVLKQQPPSFGQKQSAPFSSAAAPSTTVLADPFAKEKHEFKSPPAKAKAPFTDDSSPASSVKPTPPKPTPLMVVAPKPVTVPKPAAAAPPRAPPPAVTPTPSFVDIPVDPFLNPGEDGSVVPRGLMRDIGHMDDDEASQIVPKTKSFGDALRKRYREEDDGDDDSNDAPLVNLLGA